MRYDKIALMIVLLLIMIIFGGCGSSDNGRASFTDVNNPEDSVSAPEDDEDAATCVIEASYMLCSDGTEYELPEELEPVYILPGDNDVTEIHNDVVVIVTVIAEEGEVEAVCEKDNRNGRKCRKPKKVKK